MQERILITMKENPNVILRAIPGHFITPNAHSNYYLDMTAIKSRTHESRAAAIEFSKKIPPTTVVDTIVCMEGTQVIGAYLADELTKSGFVNVNTYKAINVITTELSSTGQYIVRDNLKPMFEGKNVIILVATAATGQTIAKVAEAIKYYGAKVRGICSVFSVANTCFGKPIYSLFSVKDLPDYRNTPAGECPMCKNGQAVDAIANPFGYSEL
ncbi:MAG: orotate phosphoribosyltransferase [Agathobacter sp.]|nr:orotate phosphoribosyltransferase [Agathobacter sp.]MBQ3559555.1 orotate phosphoribosyltransferase [Agathobacter sp.]